MLVGVGLTAWLFHLTMPQQGPQITAGASDASVLPAGRVPPDSAAPGRDSQNPFDIRDYSTTNVVSVLLGQEDPDDGINHLAYEPDGRTVIETLDGVKCRYLNRKPRSFGYLYFAIHPSFKREELKAVWIEVEYFVATPVVFRLQYDGMEGQTHKRYKSVVAEGGQVADMGGSVRFTRLRGSNAWQTAIFHIADGVFMNSQNGGADFRLEVTPPEIYLRRVSVTREDVKPAVPQPVQ